MASGAVFFIITIPTAAEEQRLKTEFIARKLDIPADLVNAKTLASLTTSGGGGGNVSDERDTLSLQTLKLPTISTNESQFNSLPQQRRRKSEPEVQLIQLSNAVPKMQVANDSLYESGATTLIEAADGGMACETESAKLKSDENLRESTNSVKQKTETWRNDVQLGLPIDAAMEVVLREILKRYQIGNEVWTKNIDGRIYQISFTVEFNEVYEKLFDKLHEWGIGDREGSSISVMNCIASKVYTHKEEEEESQHEIGKENISAHKQGVWNRFMNSVRARLNVAQIVRDVRQDAAITFDYVILLMSAAILASFGLVEDSTIFLASSMLISPLMGPIIAAIFGTVIKERSLRSIGMRNELIGILVATFVGFLFGLVVGTTDERYGIGEGLTDEMLSRCDLHSLVVGVFTAIPSGAAAAIGILGGNVGSLVGVAISASLLPPAVNSGLLWSLACIYKFFESDDSRYLYVVKSKQYSDNQAAELAILGSISMCLTLSNVLCVYIMGILVLKVKEIAPVIGRNNNLFWKHDIKIARDLTKNGLVSTDAAIIDEFANLAKEDQQALGINYDFLRKLDEKNYQHTWSPLSNRHAFEAQNNQERDNYMTIHRLEKLYTTISSPQERRRFSLARRPSGLERTSDITNRYRILLENRPRRATMSSQNDHANAGMVNDIPEIVVDLCPTTETTTKRFTVTLAPEDPLLKRLSIIE